MVPSIQTNQFSQGKSSGFRRYVVQPKYTRKREGLSGSNGLKGVKTFEDTLWEAFQKEDK
jgi:hypothetical protein